MALSYVRPRSTPGAGVEFDVDIGGNEFYEYHVGSRGEEPAPPALALWGGEQLETVQHTSSLLRRPASRNPFDSTFTLSVPRDLFSRAARHFQVVSFRDSRRSGAAWSKVLTVTPVHASFDEYLHGLPGGSRAASLGSAGLSFQHCRQVPLSFQESRLSYGMFADVLLRAVQAVAPSLIEALPGLLASLGGGSGAGGGAGTPVTAPVGGSADASTNALVALLTRLAREGLDALGGSSPAPAEPAPPPREPAPAAELSIPSALSRARRAAARNGGFSTNRGLPLRYHLSFGRASFRPSLAPKSYAMDGGILSGPLLAGLLGSLASQAPQLLGVLADKPLDFLSTLIRHQADTELRREANQQNFIQALLAEVNRSMLNDELASRLEGGALASLLAPRVSSQATAFSFQSAPRESTRFRLTFDPGTPITVGVTSKSVYRAGSGIILKLLISCPNHPPPSAPLPRAIVDLTFVDPATGQAWLRKTFPLQNVAFDAPVPLDIEAGELASVPRHKDLHVKARLRWPTANGTLAIAADHAILLTDGTWCAGLGDKLGDDIPLDDVNVYRAFWHKIWEGGLAPGSQARRWELDVLCRYYVRLRGSESSNGLVETRLQVDAQDPDESTVYTHGRMRSGLEVSLDELAKLSSAWNGSTLAPSDLDLLKQSDLGRSADTEATSRLRMRGKSEHLGAVWAFPAVALREVRLLEAATTDASGQVTRAKERRIQLPFPSAIHFVSLRSE